MNNNNLIYQPCQQGYQQHASYRSIRFHEGVGFGKSICEIFEIGKPKEDQDIHVFPDGCHDIIVTFM